MVPDHASVGQPNVDIDILVDVAERPLDVVLPEAGLGLLDSLLLICLPRLPFPGAGLSVSLPPDDVRAVLLRKSLGLREVEYVSLSVPGSLGE